MTVTLFQVGGSVRDELLGRKSKDIDFTVECSGHAELGDWLEDNGFNIFLDEPKFMTIRARFPKGFKFAGQEFAGVTADFVVCRTEAHYSDARHPDNVGIGTIDDDLARRDFTMNAIAKREDGTLYDPFGGVEDLKHNVIRAVGEPFDRLAEDPLRMLRALRFCVTKDMYIEHELAELLGDAGLTRVLIESVSEERIREELHKMLKVNTYKTLSLLMVSYPILGQFLFKYTKVWLRPTLEDR